MWIIIWIGYEISCVQNWETKMANEDGWMRKIKQKKWDSPTMLVEELDKE